MFQWDGSHLGEITDANIVAVTQGPPSPSPAPSPSPRRGPPTPLRLRAGDFLLSPIPERVYRKNVWRDPPIYWTLRIGQDQTFCLSRPIHNHLPLIIDELKRVFNLNPLGTHSVTKGNRLYLLIRAYRDPDDNIIKEIPLSKVDIDPSTEPILRSQVQELFCFRDILALSSTWESSLRIRYPHRRSPYPISYRETTMCFNTHRHIISNPVMKKWFADITIGAVARRMVGINKENYDKDLSPVIANVRTKIEATINRIDREAIWCSAFIIERLMQRILSP